MKHLAVFDFDSTLFDTEFFKAAMYRLATMHGYSLDQAKEIYKSARANDEMIVITLDTYLEALKARVTKDGKIYQTKHTIPVLAEIASHNGRLPGVAELLAAVTATGMEKRLLTLGVKSWQEQKIEQGNFTEFFSEEELVFTENEAIGKVDILHEYLVDHEGGRGIIMFNDKPTEMREMLELFPHMTVFGRWEERDERYTREEFEALEEEYPDRFMWSSSLFELRDRFEEIYG